MEWALERYGWTVAETLAMPLAALFAVFTAAQVRGGCLWGEPSYAERDELQDEKGEQE